MLRRWISIVALAFMFGMSQQGALVHEISHFDDYNPTSQQHDDDDDGGSKAAPGHFCAKCASFSALASTVGAQSLIVPLLAHSFELFLYSSTSHTRSTFLSYAARAPPVLS
jgi:hypothetical protein